MSKKKALMNDKQPFENNKGAFDAKENPSINGVEVTPKGEDKRNKIV